MYINVRLFGEKTKCVYKKRKSSHFCATLIDVFLLKKCPVILPRKNIISTALMRENPVRRPMVPPKERQNSVKYKLKICQPTNCGQHIFKLGSSVHGDPVKCGSVKVDLDKLKLRLVIKI